ncbi:MAG: hypothetical protein WA810_14085 [Maribacter sp.]
MNTLKKLLFALPIMLVVACSSDDDAGTQVTPEVVGIYNLTEVNISIAQDPNEDGTFSVNMVEELDCLNGTLAIEADGTWSLRLTQLSINSVTGDFFPVFCGNSLDYSGNWSIANNLLTLNTSTFSPFSYSDGVLTENINEDLPGILNRKYTK